MSKAVKVVLIVASAVLVGAVVAGIAVGNVLYDLALVPHTDKSMVLGSPDEEGSVFSLPDEVRETAEQRRQEQADWLSTVQPEDVYLQSQDGLSLYASKIEQTEPVSHTWAILCHGYTSDGSEMGYPCVRYYNMGFNLLVPDARGHGKSEGDYIGMGWDERLDIIGWINYLIEHDPDAEILLYGVSMGGATVMMTSGEDLPGNVKVVIEDCGYSSIRAEFSYQLHQLFGLPEFPVLDFASLVTKVRAGYWLGDGNVTAQVAKSVTPTLFIHGTEDAFVPYPMINEVYEACGAVKERFDVEGAGHGMASLYAGEAYWETVQDFISPYFSTS